MRGISFSCPRQYASARGLSELFLPSPDASLSSASLSLLRRRFMRSKPECSPFLVAVFVKFVLLTSGEAV